MSLLPSTTYLWGIATILLVPILIVLLNEATERLERREHFLANLFAFSRDVILPFFALFFVMRNVVQLDEVSFVMRMVASVFWALIIVLIFRFSRSLTIKSEDDEDDWFDSIPPLFLRLPPYLLMGYVAYHVVQNIWQIPVGELATTLGLGSVVIAFALQDTLSNLVSGLLLIIGRPFKPGEWIHISGTEGKVISVNWRYTSIQTRNGDLVIIPNGFIAGESIENHHRPDPVTRVTQSIDVAFVNPPNKVKAMLMETMLETPGILADPEPEVAVTRIDDPLMGYECRYWIADFEEKPSIHNAFMTRIWYASKRHDVPFPSPAYDLFHYDGPTVNKEGEITDADLAGMLQPLPLFNALDKRSLQRLSLASTLYNYAAADSVLEPGGREHGFYAVLNGQFDLYAKDIDGDFHKFGSLGRGGFFGENGLFGSAESQIRVVAAADADAMVIAHSTISNLLNRNPSLADSINLIITERQLVINRLAGIDQDVMADSLTLPMNGTVEVHNA